MHERPTGRVTLLVLNLSRTEAQALSLAQDAVRYTLTSNDLMSHSVQLNGKEMVLSADGDVPKPVGVMVAKGKFSLPAASISFIAVANADNPVCR